MKTIFHLFQRTLFSLVSPTSPSARVAMADDPALACSDAPASSPPTYIQTILEDDQSPSRFPCIPHFKVDQATDQLNDFTCGQLPSIMHELILGDEDEDAGLLQFPRGRFSVDIQVIQEDNKLYVFSESFELVWNPQLKRWQETSQLEMNEFFEGVPLLPDE